MGKFLGRTKGEFRQGKLRLGQVTATVQDIGIPSETITLPWGLPTITTPPIQIPLPGKGVSVPVQQVNPYLVPAIAGGAIYFFTKSPMWALLVAAGLYFITPEAPGPQPIRLPI